ncbi:hypothetical protein RUM44_007242, partial [Polyplax serrata]
MRTQHMRALNLSACSLPEIYSQVPVTQLQLFTSHVQLLWTSLEEDEFFGNLCAVARYKPPGRENEL